MKRLVDYDIDEQSSVPKYDQLRTILLDYIQNLPPEIEYLPYEYEIEAQLKISKRTIRRALDELRNDGIIETLRKRGSKIIKRDLSSPGNGRDLLSGQLIGSILLSDVAREGRTQFLPWQVTSLLEDAITDGGGSLAVYNLRSKEWHDRVKLRNALAESGIEWALVYPHQKIRPPEIASLLAELKIKTVFYFEEMETLCHLAYMMDNIDYVVVNHQRGLYRELHGNFSDADCVIYAGSNPDLHWEKPRMGVCQRFANELNIPFEVVLRDRPLIPDTDDDKEGKGMQAVHSKNAGKECCDGIIPIIKKHKRPLCLVANDAICLGVMDGLEEHNIDIPGQVRVVGYDNDTEARSRNISTFDFSPRTISEELMGLFRDFLTNPERTRTHSTGKMVYPKLIGRSTTGHFPSNRRLG